jgi:hypothetical protein
VGSGGSQEAEFDLRASVPAGAYHVECDAVITGQVDVTFALIWRRGASDTQLAKWTKHWDPLPSGFDAQAYEVDMAAGAIDFKSGDQLIFRYEGSNAPSAAEAFIPNGDGVISHGRIPSITLPR